MSFVHSVTTTQTEGIGEKVLLCAFKSAILLYWIGLWCCWNGSMFVCIGGPDNVADGILLTIEQQSVEPSCEHTLASPSSIETCGKDIDPTNHTRTDIEREREREGSNRIPLKLIQMYSIYVSFLTTTHPIDLSHVSSCSFSPTSQSPNLCFFRMSGCSIASSSTRARGTSE